MAATYFYYFGQDISLNKIINEMPTLRSQALLAKSQFDRTFKAAIRNIDETLTAKNTPWKDTKPAIERMVVDKIASTTYTVAEAEAFIRDVERRAEGSIPSPMLETILTFHPDFVANPAEEFTRRFKREFRTDGTGKAKGMRLRMEYPASWKSLEARGPNTIREMVSENGRGLESVLIIIKDIPLPNGQKITKRDIDDLFIRSSLMGMVPKGGRFVSNGETNLAGLRTAWLRYAHKQETPLGPVMGHFLAYTFFYQNKLTTIQFTAGDKGTVPNRSLEERFAKFEPLFKLMASSVMIDNQFR